MSLHISFSASLLFPPPKDMIFLEMGTTVFYKLVYLPIWFGVFHLYCPLYSLRLYLFHPPELWHMQTSSLRPTHLHTIPATRHIFVNTSIRQRLLSFFYPIPVLQVTFLILKICCSGSLRLGVSWVGRVETALFMMQVIGTKQIQEQPLVSERSNQTQSQRY